MAELEQKPNSMPVTAETVEPVWATLPPDRPRKVSASMFGPPEIGAVAAGLLAFLMAMVAVFFWMIPSGRELAKNKSEADRLEAELILAESKYGNITTTETQVARLVSSVDDFETRFLPVSATGQSALYQRLNGLIAAYNLTNTAGPDYAPLESVLKRQGQETTEEKGRAKFRSLYPGVYVSTTLEGSYQNLRRFIREIETGREFIVVSAIELAPTDTQKQKDSTGPNNNQPANAIPINQGNPNLKELPPGVGSPIDVSPPRVRNQGKVHGETVSLSIELAAYFRRPNFVPTSEPASE